MARDPVASDFHVATVTDRAYLPYAATTLLSLVEASPDLRLTAHVLHDASVDGDDRAALSRLIKRSNADVNFVPIDEGWLSQFPSKGAAAGNQISWARLSLPKVLPGVSRVLYIDADTFVCDSVGELLTMELGDDLVAAVPNIVQPVMRQYVEGLGIDDHRSYFNAGVLVMDLDGFRREAVVDQIVELIERLGDRFFWFDQDTLNLVVGSRCRRLHPRWNAQNSFWGWADVAEEVLGTEDVAAAKSDPAVLHFEGPAVYKPWHLLCRHPYADQYRAVMARTPWNRQGTLGLDRYSRLIGALPQGWQMPVHHRLEAWKTTFGQMRRST